MSVGFKPCYVCPCGQAWKLTYTPRTKNKIIKPESKKKTTEAPQEHRKLLNMEKRIQKTTEVSKVLTCAVKISSGCLRRNNSSWQFENPTPVTSQCGRRESIDSASCLCLRVTPKFALKLLASMVPPEGQ